MKDNICVREIDNGTKLICLKSYSVDFESVKGGYRRSTRKSSLSIDKRLQIIKIPSVSLENIVVNDFG